MSFISVVIPTYNRLYLLKRVINTIANQNFGNDKYEIVIVDDCSNDNTKYYLKNLKLNINYSYIINKNNLGRALSRNKGIRNSRGDLIILIDHWCPPTPL